MIGVPPPGRGPAVWGSVEDFLSGDPHRENPRTGPGRHLLIFEGTGNGLVSERWSVRWIPATGELYAIRVRIGSRLGCGEPAIQAGPVRLLGIVPTLEHLEDLLPDCGELAARPHWGHELQARIERAAPAFRAWVAAGLAQLQRAEPA